MKPALFLRIASIVALLYFLGHSSGVPWTPVQGPAEMAVIGGMKSNPFDMMGVQRTYWDFYLGSGLIISLYVLLQAVVLWLVAGLAKRGADVRPIVAAFLVTFVINAFLAWKYFFAIPLIVTTAIALCLALALVAESMARRRKTEP